VRCWGEGSEVYAGGGSSVDGWRHVCWGLGSIAGLREDIKR
jgi:hypothetical protein